ncbi:MAG: EAL domain-containing protein [Pseudomonadota bacterium]
MSSSSATIGPGRRLFLTFLVVAALPVIAVSVYALSHLTATVQEQRQAVLADVVQSQGQLLKARLEEALLQLLRSDTVLEGGAFQSLESSTDVSPSGPRVALETSGAGVWLLLRGSQTGVRALLSETWLWRGTVTLPPGVVLCLESLATIAPVYCGNREGSVADASPLLDRLDDAADRGFQLGLGKENPVQHVRQELVINEPFAGAALELVAFRTDTSLLGELGLGRLLAALAGLSVVLAALAAFLLRRRQQQPMQALKEATDRVGMANFDLPVQVDDDDEFGDLGQRFNAMMVQLQEQVGRYRSNAEIDQLILQSESPETVLNLILGRAFSFVEADFLTIGIIDPESPTEAICQSTRKQDGKITPLSRATLSDADLALLASARHPVGLDPRWAGAESMRELGGSSGLLLGITWHSRPLGFVLAGMPAADTSEAEIRSQAMELRDRVAVTLTAAEKEKALFAKANFDSLTGLPNRHLLEDRLRLACDSNLSTGEPFALLFLDLDNFKLVNDSVGHEGGDQLLREVAGRLNDLCQPGDAIARLGGDEFVMLLTSYRTPQDLDQRAQEVIAALSDAVTIGGHSTEVNASIGIAIYPEDGTTPGQLLRNADAAMYRSKELGRNRVTFFTDDINLEITRKFQILTQLRTALAENSLTLAYQPQLSLRTGNLCGAEVLVRWPESGVSPGEMIQIAEDYGVINALGRWVLERACSDFAGLDETLRPPKISVNVSARQLADPQFVDFVAECLARHALDASKLELEITESLLVNDNGWAIRQLQQLKEVGLNLALDDFGTGYSSLTYLQRLPVDSIKIDRSFVTRVDCDDTQQGFVTAVVQLAHSLGKRTVAEGAETDLELRKLKALGCDDLQGYVFSEPLPGIDQLAEFIVRRQFERSEAADRHLAQA